MDIPKLMKEAESGSLVAQTVMGICYLEGWEPEVKVNYAEAFRLLSIAAKRGAPRAKANLARMYEEGLAVRKDLPQAIRLYKSAAEAREFYAQIALGRIYSSGRDIPADPDEASRWYSAAVSLGTEDSEELREAKAYIAKVVTKKP